MIIVDSTVRVDYLRGTQTPHTDWLEAKLTVERLGFTDPIPCEEVQGTTADGQFDAVKEDLLGFEVFETGTISLALEAAVNYRRLRVAGRTVRRTIDCLIVSFCLVEGHMLLQHDRGYDPFEEGLGLPVVHPQG